MKTSQRLLRGPFLWIVVLVLVMFFAVSVFNSASAPEEIPVTRFLELAESDQLVAASQENETPGVEVGLRSFSITGEYRDGNDRVPFTTTYSEAINGDQIGDLVAQGQIEDLRVNPEQNSTLVTLLINMLPFVLIFGLFFFLMQQMQGGGGRVMQFGKSKAKMVNKDAPKVTFADVAGAEEAIEELREIKDFLENPQKFQAMGAKIPKGALLFGPPGTGKTLLARAVAGEAGVPFFSISGSDFVEMFVGVGASRVRDLFEQAKENAPAIIFMDEIDAVGRHRGAGMGGGHDEREQTLNQLLVEMDGFDQRTAVILIAATNRPDILDPALLRPGRFDRQITVDRPDLLGREAILKIHSRGKPLADDIDLKVLARQTPGFTGADLANLVNEAAILAARFGKKEITQAELAEAIDRVIAGPERKTKLMSDKERTITAFHEAGHAIVGHALPHNDPVHKITIIPRGRAGGYTMALPTEDKSYNTRGELTDKLAMMLGGRVAEEIKIGDVTTGASNDIQKATALAREMVTQYGMSDRLGPILLGQKDSQPFLGRDFGHTPDYSARVAEQIDLEIRHMLDHAHDEALQVLVDNDDVLETMGRALLEEETLEGDRLEEILAAVRLRPSRALVPPDGQGPDRVIELLRRLAPGTNGTGNGHRNGHDHDRDWSAPGTEPTPEEMPASSDDA
ncbi:ATP-dependent zinc metalloprotease FtsH [Salsipaludibacter albus]|uniref:ATP-dependent zinc metalloprotease FtsH n=1 Tax=Salsipaludibacter albus TaxID=2849650 RepID=UPI00308406E4